VSTNPAIVTAPGREGDGNIAVEDAKPAIIRSGITHLSNFQTVLTEETRAIIIGANKITSMLPRK
jgi:hypothetical protein